MLLTNINFGDVYNYGVEAGLDWTKIALVIVSIISLGVSYYNFQISRQLFKNSDAKKLFVKKQVETIWAMLEDMRKQTISITHIYLDSQIRTPIYIKVSEIKNYLEKDYLKEIMDNVSIHVEYSLLQSYKFIDYRSNLYLPSNIARELDKFYTELDMTYPHKMGTMGNANYIHKSGTYPSLISQTDVTNYTGKGKPYERSIRNYLEHFLLIQRISVVWLKHYDINVNITDI
jgi:hypothetical protein